VCAPTCSLLFHTALLPLQVLQWAQMLILQALRLQGFMDLTYEADASPTGADGASKELGSGAAPTAGHASPLPASLAVGMNGNVCASPAVGGTNGTPRGGGNQSQSQQQAVGGSSGSAGKLLQPKRLVQRPVVGSMGSEDVLLHACRVLPSSSNTEGPLGSGVHAGGSGSNAGMCMLRSCGLALFVAC
jgi:hypothetical protein